MYSLENDYESKRRELTDQYVTLWRTDESFKRCDELCERVLSFADTISVEPHPVIKARCFEYLLKHAPVVINPDDWFGITLEAAKMDPLRDIGCFYVRPLTKLNDKWAKELDAELNPPEDADFVAHTRDYLFNELYIYYNHSTPCWEDIFSLGISGILERARSYRAKHEPLTDRQRVYFDGIEISFSALIDLFKRYVSELRERVEPRLVIMREAIDIVLHPTAVSGDDGLCAFSALVRTYFAKGGHSVQFNVFSASELIDAQKHPEKYRNLQIRVCGWNVYFVELEKKLQDAFTRECLHREGAI